MKCLLKASVSAVPGKGALLGAAAEGRGMDSSSSLFFALPCSSGEVAGDCSGTFPCHSTPLELFSWETQGVRASGSPQPVLPPQAGSSHQFAWQREVQGAWRSQFPLHFRRSTQ